MLRDFIKCCIYLIIVGIAGFFAGRILPKNSFTGKHFPFKCFKFEKNGKIYDKLKVRRWQAKMPDMSRIFKKLMPAKKFAELKNDAAKLPAMIRETCVAEFIHDMLFILGFGCVFICSGVMGWIVSVIYNLFGNLPFIIIQRYNRPRLIACQKAAQRAGLAAAQ